MNSGCSIKITVGIDSQQIAEVK